ncbi:pseudouridine synthase [Mycoplasma marinum]|uniref:rRNA pseudouridine synthase n=1 Tax=Mycoplasma marinum TaxID=1937190 RepID=A0A4R0XMN4_9MOLU|nr:pseudouridine synthase [Mycoplasma marinum]TCG11797.1 rRNA pseudouridine synthase [Mycoplasma marinum]
MKNEQRIQKLISQAGVASRRKAEELIQQGKVVVNERVAKIGDKATFKDDILVNGIPLIKQQHIYFIMNKPLKTITSLSDDRERVTVVDLIKENAYVFPVGRLDYNTTGTLLLTNDGDLANKLMHPSSQIPRTYRARLERPLTDSELNFLNSDKVLLDGEKTEQVVQKVDAKAYMVSLTQGKYHHIKRMFELVGVRVQSLSRMEFAGLTCAGIKKGDYRQLRSKEIKWLKQLVK